MSDPAAIRRQLKIKSGAVQRLFKETSLYQKEADQLEVKRAKFVQDGAEEWDIKNATKMMEESNKMVNDTETRLAKATDELSALITSAKEESNMGEDEELLKAETLLKETSKA